MNYKEKYNIQKLQNAAKILKTIGHPVKLEILLILSENEKMDVSNICKSIGADCQISMMSHHLSKMKDNGIVTSTKVGKQVYYELKNRQILNIFKCMDNCDWE